MYDWIGYIASGLVAVSMLFASTRLLRLINSLGAVIFVFYGILVPVYPVAITNGFILIVNCVHLWRDLRAKRS